MTKFCYLTPLFTTQTQNPTYPLLTITQNLHHSPNRSLHYLQKDSNNRTETTSSFPSNSTDTSDNHYPQPSLLIHHTHLHYVVQPAPQSLHPTSETFTFTMTHCLLLSQSPPHLRSTHNICCTGMYPIHNWLHLMRSLLIIFPFRLSLHPGRKLVQIPNGLLLCNMKSKLLKTTTHGS